MKHMALESKSTGIHLKSVRTFTAIYSNTRKLKTQREFCVLTNCVKDFNDSSMSLINCFLDCSPEINFQILILGQFLKESKQIEAMVLLRWFQCGRGGK